MAFCAKCRKQIPPEAAHCVHCGAAVVRPAIDPKRTVLGFGPKKADQQPQQAPHEPSDAYMATMFSAEDESQRVPISTGPGSPSQPAVANQATESYKPTLAPPSALPSKGSVPSVAWQEAAPSEDRSQEFLPTMMAQPGQAPLAASDQSQEFPATMMAHPSQLPGGQSQEVPATLARPDRSQEFPATIMAQPGQSPAFAQPPSPASGAAPDTAARLVLASHSIAADAHPVEPGRGKLRWLLIGGGALLLIAFCLPSVITNEGLGGFSWQMLSKLKGLALISQLYLAAGGALMILIGSLPLPYVARGIMALTISGLPLLLLSIGGTWRQAITLISLLVLCGGLLHRYRYRGSKLARVMVAVGVVGVLLTLLVPLQGAVPLVAVFEQFGGEAGAAQVVAAIMPLLLLALSLASLLAFLGPESSGLANLWAICLLLFLPVSAWMSAAFSLAAGGKSLVLLNSGLSLLVYLTVAALGLAHILTIFTGPPTTRQPQ